MTNDRSYIFSATEQQYDNGTHFQSCILIGTPIQIYDNFLKCVTQYFTRCVKHSMNWYRVKFTASSSFLEFEYPFKPFMKRCYL
jgi:hypothetical protein